jgi:D-alanine-D-alanine ligase
MPALKLAVVLGDPRLPYPYAKEGAFGPEDVETVAQLKAALARLSGVVPHYFDDHARLIDDLRAARPDLALNLCDTGFNNQWDLERNVPALLEILGIPYTGADPMAISLSTDKALVRYAAQALGVPVPNESFVDLTADPPLLPSTYPALIKPNASGGSFGVTEQCVVETPEAAEAYLRWLAAELPIPEALIQDFLTGAEYTVGLVGNPDRDLTVLPALEIDYSRLDPGLPPVLTYGSKADPDSPYWARLAFCRAELDPLKAAQLAAHAAALFKRLGFRDYGRFDFRDGADGQPRLLDANTNPTWSHDGKMALMAAWAGHDYAGLLALILRAAVARYGLGAEIGVSD